MTFDLGRARRERPGCDNVLHFNNAGASLMPAPVLDATVAGIPGVQPHDLGVKPCGIVTFTVADHQPEAIKQRLAAERINVTTSTPFSTRLDMERRGLDGLVQASLHYYNSDEEIERFVGVLSRVARG